MVIITYKYSALNSALQQHHPSCALSIRSSFLLCSPLLASLIHYFTTVKVSSTAVATTFLYASSPYTLPNSILIPHVNSNGRLTKTTAVASTVYGPTGMHGTAHTAHNALVCVIFSFASHILRLPSIPFQSS